MYEKKIFSYFKVHIYVAFNRVFLFNFKFMIFFRRKVQSIYKTHSFLGNGMLVVCPKLNLWLL